MLRSRAGLLFLAVVCASSALARGASSSVLGVESVGGVAFFTTTQWVCRSGGTPAGTVCHPMRPGAFGKPVLLNGKLYTLANEPRDASVYAFDGQSAPVEAFSIAVCYEVKGLATNGKHLFLLAQDIFASSWRLYLVRSDGTGKGTTFLPPFNAYDGELVTRAGDSVLFRIGVPTSTYPQYEWWASDGTKEGTRLLFPSSAQYVATVGPIALFADGGKLWRTDGTATGTFVLMNEWTPTRVAIRDGVAWFTAARQVWRTDGTFAMPLRKVDFDPSLMGATGARLVFLEKRENAVIVWSANDTYGIPTEIASIRIRNKYVELAEPMTHTASLAFFTVRTGSDTELWRSDGTREGTFRVGEYVNASGAVRFGEKVFFRANDGVHGLEPWSTDGTHDNTFLLANLAGEGTVRGRVTDRKTGLPVADAVVTVNDINGATPAVRTDEDGRYTVEGFVGMHRIEARGPMHRALAKDINVNAGEESTLDFELRAGARIAGRVVDANGKPVKTIVTLFSDVGAPVQIHTTERGRFESEALWTEAPWWAEAWLEGHNRATTGPFRLTLGETHEIELTLRPYGRLFVRLIDAKSNAPIPDLQTAPTKLHTTGDRKVVTYGVLTDDQTALEFAVPDGEYLLSHELHTHRPAFYGSPVRIASGTTQTIDFVVEPRGVAIHGIVRDAETGARLSNVMVSATTLDKPSPGRVVMTEGGAFETSAWLADGRCRIEAQAWWHSEYLPFETEIVIRFADDPRPEVDIYLTRGATLRGRVVDQQGEPIQYAKVEVSPTRFAYADVHGYYALLALPTGTYTAVVTHPKFAEARATVQVTAGKKTKQDFALGGV